MKKWSKVIDFLPHTEAEHVNLKTAVMVNSTNSLSDGERQRIIYL